MEADEHLEEQLPILVAIEMVASNVVARGSWQKMKVVVLLFFLAVLSSLEMSKTSTVFFSRKQTCSHLVAVASLLQKCQSIGAGVDD